MEKALLPKEKERPCCPRIEMGGLPFRKLKLGLT